LNPSRRRLQKVGWEIYIIAYMDEAEERGTAAEAAGRQLDLPFDQYQRYRIVADVIERLREDDSPLQILDVGGGEGIILNFLPEDRVTILDQAEPEEVVPGFVKGDATALPFEDGSYDYVVSVDVYEHIPPGVRGKYLSELRRAARKGVLLAAPFDSEMVRGAERAADEFHRAVHLAGNVWLQEHAENGLPGLEDARQFSLKESVEVDLGEIASSGPNSERVVHSSTLFGTLSAMFPLATELKRQNTWLVQHERRLVQREETLARREARADAQLAEYKRHLEEKEGMMARREAQINDLSRRLAERVSAANTLSVQAEQRMARLHQTHSQLQQAHNQLRQKTTGLEEQNANLERHRNRLQRQLEEVTTSRVWRVLSLQHRLRRWIKRLLGSG
jgi:ubiquinone/menaquinone biosynthesis C-methylase UbiE